MPELPEVEIALRGIAPFLESQIITQCVLNSHALRYPFGDNFKNILEGAKALSLQRRGKFILVHFDNHNSLIWHLGMSGRIRTFATASDYIAEKHDHVILQTARKQLVVYNDARRFGFMKIAPTLRWQEESHFLGMGPEPLGNAFNGPALYDALKGKTMAIKLALLDQRIVAGIGNIYASEALFESRINPAREAGKIKKNEIERLCSAIKNVLARAIEAGGSSLRDYQHTDGSLGYFQNMVHVYNRTGEPCTACGKTILKKVQGGRSTFYCSSCQK